jgi:hypothetical protein
MYDHFTSKEDLARAVIEAGSARFAVACRPFLSSPISAVEVLIGISCLLLDPAVNDTMVQATFRLLTQVPDRPGSDPTLLATWLSDYRELVRRAGTEGDLRGEDPMPSLYFWWKPLPGSDSWPRPPATSTIYPSVWSRPGAPYSRVWSTQPNSTTSVNS